MTASPDEAPLLFLIAGEPSGDLLGGALMAALKRRSHRQLRFAGIGGERMAAEGLRSLVPIEELAVMGIAEVLPRVRRILRRVAETADAVSALRPAAVVTIDSSGFSWRVARRLRERGESLPLIHYVAPMVWAWRSYNAAKMARWYDHLMALLPFEPPYFEAVGLPCTYVGHPVIEGGAGSGDGPGFRARHGIPAEAPLLCLLPGSRRGEVQRLLPVFAEAVARVAPRHPGLRLVLPTVANVAAAVEAATGAWPLPVIVLRGAAEKFAAFAAADAALAASGTVALELAIAEVPAIVAYRTNPITAWHLKRVVRAKYANLVNVILDRPAIPELLLEQCTPERVSSALERLLADPAARQAQREAYRACRAILAGGGASPSERAAQTVLSVMAAGPRARPQR